MILSKASSNNRQAKMYRIKGLLLMGEILNHLRLVVRPTFYRVLYIPVHKRFLPSTVCLDWSDDSLPIVDGRYPSDLGRKDFQETAVGPRQPGWKLHDLYMLNLKDRFMLLCQRVCFFLHFYNLRRAFWSQVEVRRFSGSSIFDPTFFFGLGRGVKSGNPKNHSLGYHEIWWRTSCRCSCGIGRMC